jgi:hypothetical protein
VINRQGANYTVSASTCIYDDPRDGVADHPAGYGFCSTSPSTSPYNGSSGDSNPDDFRRVDVTISWNSEGSRSHQLQQSVLIVNPSGGLGPRITSVTPSKLLVQDGLTVCTSQPGCQTISGGSTSAGPITVTTATPAQALHWSTDDGISGNSITGPLTSFNVYWPLGDPVTGVLDGVYTLSVQAFDDRAVPGDLRATSVLINRRLPIAPTAVQGGWDTRLCAPDPTDATAAGAATADSPCSNDAVDLQWSPNRERDIVGYHVWYDADGSGTQTSGDRLVSCTVNGTPQTLVTTTSCLDQNPPNRSGTASPQYVVTAVDQRDLADPTSSLRDGDPTPLTVLAAGKRPYFPAETLTAAVQNSTTPSISWTAGAIPQDASANPRILFYRIYRDPSGSSSLSLAARYDRTSTNATNYKDPNPGSTTSHTYWVTAVDDRFNESAPLGPFQT